MILKYNGISNPFTINKDDIIKEGNLNKKSRIRKIWKQRWTILTNSFIATFVNENKFYKHVHEFSKSVTISPFRNPNEALNLDPETKSQISEMHC